MDAVDIIVKGKNMINFYLPFNFSFYLFFNNIHSCPSSTRGTTAFVELSIGAITQKCTFESKSCKKGNDFILFKRGFRIIRNFGAYVTHYQINLSDLVSKLKLKLWQNTVLGWNQSCHRQYLACREGEGIAGQGECEAGDVKSSWWPSKTFYCCPSGYIVWIVL